MHIHESASSVPLSAVTSATPVVTNAAADYGYSVRLAQPDELEQVFRLRHSVFFKELGPKNLAQSSGCLDVDVYDSICDHLVAVRNGEIVGTYRLLPIARALERGLNPYCSTEFEVSPLIQAFGSGLLELGRTCVAYEHRNGVVPRLLWKFLLKYVLKEKFSAMIGCVSVYGLSDLQSMAAREQLKSEGMWHSHWNLSSKMPAPQYTDGIRQEADLAPRIELPPLMKAYAGLGAKVCAGPALDREFGCADYLMLAEVDKIPSRYLRLFLA